jgi:hypothetical protein
MTPSLRNLLKTAKNLKKNPQKTQKIIKKKLSKNTLKIYKKKP